MKRMEGGRMQRGGGVEVGICSADAAMGRGGVGYLVECRSSKLKREAIESRQTASGTVTSTGTDPPSGKTGG